MRPQRRTVLIWLLLGSVIGLAVMVWFDTYRSHGECAALVCVDPTQGRRITALHLLEGAGIGAAIALGVVLIWVGFTYCIPQQPPVISPPRRRPWSAGRHRR